MTIGKKLYVGFGSILSILVALLIVNLIAGLIFWFASRRVTRSAHLRYFLWLSMTLNFFGAGGDFLFSGVGNIGDWAAVIDGFHPAWLWRIGLTLLGIGSYGLFMWVALLEMRPFLPQTGPERWKRAKKLSMVPYFADGILSCVAGLFNPVGMILVAISAAAASFGGASAFVGCGTGSRARGFQPELSKCRR